MDLGGQASKTFGAGNEALMRINETQYRHTDEDGKRKLSRARFYIYCIFAGATCHPGKNH
jgi:hypothetical protein